MNEWTQLISLDCGLMLIPALPLLLACCFFARRWQSLMMILSPWAALPAVLLAVLAPADYAANISWLLLDTLLGITATARTFLFFTSLVWLAAGVYAVSYLRQKPDASRFFVCYLLAMSGNLGLIIAQDMISFYCFFALMSFASYGLVVHSETKPAREAGKVYITLVVMGELLVFTALALAAHVSESFYFADLPARIALAPERHLIIGMALVGFGIKAGALPLHVWLPLAHPVAPTPASAILSGTMIKAGLLGWLHLLPLGAGSFPMWGAVVVIGGFVAAFGGVLVGLTQSQPKTVLAYSSISQMGMMTVAVGAGLLSPEIWPLCLTAILIYATHHAFAKAALFLGVSVAAGRAVGWAHRVVILGGLLLPALSLAGAPLSSGFLAKNSLKYGLTSLIKELQWSEAILSLLTLSALATTLLLARFFWTLRRSVTMEASAARATAGMLVPWMGLVAVSLLLPFQRLIPGLETAGGSLYGADALWTLVIGVAIAILMIKCRCKIPMRVPAGDILVFYRAGMNAGQRGLLCVNQRLLELADRLGALAAQMGRVQRGWLIYAWRRMRNADRCLSAWPVVGAGLSVLFIMIYLLL